MAQVHLTPRECGAPPALLVAEEVWLKTAAPPPTPGEEAFQLTMSCNPLVISPFPGLCKKGLGWPLLVGRHDTTFSSTIPKALLFSLSFSDTKDSVCVVKQHDK